MGAEEMGESEYYNFDQFRRSQKLMKVKVNPKLNNEPTKTFWYEPNVLRLTPLAQQCDI